MKLISFWILGGMLVFFCVTEDVRAQFRPEKSPFPEEEMKEGKPGKSFRDFKDKEGKERRMMRPEPILMAGDPRFQKMLLLAFAPPEQVEAKAKEWPGFAEMNEERKSQMKKEMEMFRARVFRAALKNAEESGLTLSEEQKPIYVRRYWERRGKVEAGIRTEVQERLKMAMEKENAELKKEFSGPATAKP